MHISPEYSYLTDFISVIPDIFAFMGEEVHTGRNEIRRVNIRGLVVVIKYFKSMTWANRLIYSTIRKSKAQRAFENSKRLQIKGINTPDPIAYIDVYRRGLLSQSFYVSLFLDFEPADQLFKSPLAQAEEGLRAFARFTYGLHRRGIYHNDYNLGNILYSRDGSRYLFALIDNNRMAFLPYTRRRGLRNLQRLQLTLEQLGVVGAEYARVSQANGTQTLFDILKYRMLFHYRNAVKDVFKSLLNNRYSLKRMA